MLVAKLIETHVCLQSALYCVDSSISVEAPSSACETCQDYRSEARLVSALYTRRLAAVVVVEGRRKRRS